ncbi:MAG: hypothetical protein VKJ24_20190 [Synechococcales bacterium]|nr:hypothetical protein [Synechococcales bacterium]
MNLSFYTFGLTALLITALNFPGSSARSRSNPEDAVSLRTSASPSQLTTLPLEQDESRDVPGATATAVTQVQPTLSTQALPKSPAQPTFPKQPPVTFEGSACTQLNEAASEVETAMISLYFALDLRRELIEEQFQRTQTNLKRLQTLKFTQPQVRSLQTQYTNKVQPLLPAIATQVRPGLTLQQRRALAASFKVEIDEINQFRHNAILLEDCKSR